MIAVSALAPAREVGTACPAWPDDRPGMCNIADVDYPQLPRRARPRSTVLRQSQLRFRRPSPVTNQTERAPSGRTSEDQPGAVVTRVELPPRHSLRRWT